MELSFGIFYCGLERKNKLRKSKGMGGLCGKEKFFFIPRFCCYNCLYNQCPAPFYTASVISGNHDG